MKRFLINIICAICILHLNAQNSIIKGRLTGMDSTTAVAGALVMLENTSYSGISNGQGIFELKNLKAGTYALRVTNIGYQSVRKELAVKENEVLDFYFALQESIASLPEIIIMTQGSNGLKEIPGSVHYISLKEIQKFNYTDINRTLGMVPGIHIQEEDGFGLRPNIGMRGTGAERSSKISVMEDGVLIAPAPYSEPAAYYFPTIGRMQAIEVLKGSSQIKYGPFTTGGAINLLSTAIPDEFSGKINLWMGNFGTTNLHAHAGNRHKNISYLFETFQYRADGFKKLDGGGPTGFDKKDYLVKISFHTNPEANIPQSLSFKMDKTSEVSDETYLGLTAGDYESNPYRRYYASQKDQMIGKHYQFSVVHTIQPSTHFKIKTIAYKTKFERNWYKLDKVKNLVSGAKINISDILDNPEKYIEEYQFMSQLSNVPPSNSLILKANNRSYYAQGIQSNFIYNFENDFATHRIEMSLRFHKDAADRFQWEDEYTLEDGDMSLIHSGTPGSESNRIIESKAIAAFVQYKLGWNRFTFTPGLRYEKIKSTQLDYGKNDRERTGAGLILKTNDESVIIPGIGIDYLFSKSIHGFIGIHKGFSPPGPQDETKPEISVNYECGLRLETDFIKLNTTVFLNDYSNLLGSDLTASGGTGSGDLFNGGAVETKGIEFELRYDLNQLLPKIPFTCPVSLSYTHIQALFKNSFRSTFEDWGEVALDDELPYTAPNQISVQLSPEFKSFQFTLSSKFLDAMRTRPGQAVIDQNELIPSHFVVDLSAKYMLNRNFTFFANALNLLDKTYLASRRPAGMRPGMPRTCFMGVTVLF